MTAVRRLTEKIQNAFIRVGLGTAGLLGNHRFY
jgi:hypothetical protein